MFRNMAKVVIAKLVYWYAVIYCLKSWSQILWLSKMLHCSSILVAVVTQIILSCFEYCLMTASYCCVGMNFKFGTNKESSLSNRNINLPRYACLLKKRLHLNYVVIADA